MTVHSFPISSASGAVPATAIWSRRVHDRRGRVLIRPAWVRGGADAASPVSVDDRRAA